MKKLAVIIVISMFFIMGSTAYGGQFGPPEPAAKEGNVSLGVGYFYSSAKWEPEDPGWNESKAKQNQAYLQLSYSFIKNWEGYIRVGGADGKIKEAFDFDSPQDFKDGFKPFGTIGVKGVFNISPSFGIGPFLQASLYSNYKDEETGTVTVLGTPVPVSATLKIKKPWEIDFGIGLEGKIGGAILYAGPFLYWTRAKVEESATALGVTVTDSTTYEEKNNVGGFAGLRLPLAKGLNFEVEGQLKSKFSFGTALSYSF